MNGCVYRTWGCCLGGFVVYRVWVLFIMSWILSCVGFHSTVCPLYRLVGFYIPRLWAIECDGHVRCTSSIQF
ncbi:hypothetical protein BDV32DRAFT_115050 [Aspergillus pseudonomiae]|nr:hypothetical protein BDV32DRAFT_115050 [Aspergillus pseudonomiae]